MNHIRGELIAMFERQQAFASEYSPLYSRLFGVVAAWLSVEEASTTPFAEWLVEAAQGRQALDVTLLLAAGLHRDILRGIDQAAGFSQYYPTAGGKRPPDDLGFERNLREAVMSRRRSLAKVIQQENVQTNETGRGLCWLLPTMLTGWRNVHLLDLGASAGLNLAADLRSYRLLDTGGEASDILLGHASPAAQFTTRCSAAGAIFERIDSERLPTILSRTGCDASPFSLAAAEDEMTLMSFVWGDQVERMDRLREGIDAYRRCQESAAPVQVYRCDLSNNLQDFLASHIPSQPSAPIVIYNSYVTPYLEGKGRPLGADIGRWASRQDNPVLWLQWEPSRAEQNPPVDGWIAWLADLWMGDKHQRQRLGWVHPHGGEAVFSGEWKFDRGA